MGELVVEPLSPLSAEYKRVLFSVRHLLFEPSLTPSSVTVYALGALNPPALTAGHDARVSSSPHPLTRVLSLLDMASLSPPNNSVESLVRNGLRLDSHGAVFPSGPPSSPPPSPPSELLLAELALSRALALPLAQLDLSALPTLPDGFDSYALTAPDSPYPQYLVRDKDAIALRYYVRIARGPDAFARPPVLLSSSATSLGGKPGLVRACPDHPDQVLGFWCRECALPLCVYDKMVGSHALGEMAQHPLVPLESIAADVGATVQAGIRNDHRVDAHLSAVEAELDALAQTRQAVTDQAGTAAALLKEKYESALRQLETITQFHLSILASDQVELTRQAETMASIQALERASLSVLDPASLVAAIDASRTSLATLTQHYPIPSRTWNPSLSVRGSLVVSSGVPPPSSSSSSSTLQPATAETTSALHGSGLGLGGEAPVSGVPQDSNRLMWTQIVGQGSPSGPGGGAHASSLVPAKPMGSPLLASRHREAAAAAAHHHEEQHEERPLVEDDADVSRGRAPGSRSRKRSKKRRKKVRSPSRKHHSQYGHRSPMGRGQVGPEGVRTLRKYRRRGVRRLVRLLVQDEFALPLDLGRVLATSSSPDVFRALRETAYDLVQVAHGEGLGLQLVLAGLQSVFKGVDGPAVDADIVASLFNGSSLASHVMVAYSQVVGLAFVQSVLGPVFSALSRGVPGAATSSSHRGVRREALVSAFVDALYGCDDQVPSQFVTILGRLYAETEAGQLSDAAVKALGSFLVLRVFCPAIAKPALYGLDPGSITPSELLVVSTVLQHLVSGVAFAADSEHTGLNEYLRTTYPEFKTWLSRLGKASAQGALAGLEYPLPPVKGAELSSSILALATTLDAALPSLPVSSCTIHLSPDEPPPSLPRDLQLGHVLGIVLKTGNHTATGNGNHAATEEE